jgi:hypothetical protein
VRAASLWAIQNGTSTEDYAKDMAVGPNGNVFVTGYTEGALDGNKNAGARDIFLSKFDPDGNKLWTMQAGSVADEEATGVDVDADGYAIVVGYTTGRLKDNSYLGAAGYFVPRHKGY